MCFLLCRYEVLYELKGHSDTITGMSLSHDGNFLLTNAADDTLRVWDVRPFCSAQSRCTRVLTGHVHTFEKNLLKCAWSKDDTKVRRHTLPLSSLSTLIATFLSDEK